MPFVLASALLAACAGAGAAAPVVSSLGQAQTPQGDPLDAYLLTEDQMRQWGAASASLIADCMRRSGFTYSTDAVEFPVATSGRLFGITSLEEAQARGYHPDLRQPDFPEPNPDSDTAAYQHALGGRDPNAGTPGGCEGEALAALGSPSAANQLASGLKHDAWDRSRADDRTQAALRKWSDCMQEAGYNYTDPIAAGNDPAFSGKTATRAEIAVAVRDVQCKERVGLVDTWNSAFIESQQELIEQNQLALDEARAQQEQIMEHAAQVLADASAQP
ncbi:MAG TPA: hypothetical protein PLT68_07060 [Actinomycetota bacterium]|nr:hypothetical protein [Actinomycetota bacterium]